MSTATYTLRDTTTADHLGPAATEADLAAWVAALKCAAEADDRVVAYSHPEYELTAESIEEAQEIFGELKERAWNGGDFA